MSTLFERLKTDLPSGWCSDLKAQTLAAAVIALRPAITVEIGVWFGRSLAAMALAHKEIAHGVVWAIDPWEAQASAEGQVNPADREWWGEKVDHEVVYHSFCESVNALAIQNVVNVVRKRSDEVIPPEFIGLVHNDGNHGPQAIRDTQRFAPHVKVGGLWVVDDINWSGGFVEKSIDLLPALGFIELYRVKDKDNAWAVYQRVEIL